MPFLNSAGMHVHGAQTYSQALTHIHKKNQLSFFLKIETVKECLGEVEGRGEERIALTDPREPKSILIIDDSCPSRSNHYYLNFSSKL
jgi:PleD family two-component response regulator